MAGGHPSVFGSSVTFTAVTGKNLAGVVTFKDGSTQLGSQTAKGTNPTLTFSTSALAIGAHNITAVFGSDPKNTGSTSPVVVQTVKGKPTTTALSASPASGSYGTSVTVSATLTTGAADQTGSLTLYDGAPRAATA